jgi:hypothetical protein
MLNENKGITDNQESPEKKAIASLDRKITELQKENEILRNDLSEKLKILDEKELTELKMRIAIENNVPAEFRSYLQGENETELKKSAKILAEKCKKNWAFNNEVHMSKNKFVPGSGFTSLKSEIDFSDYQNMSSFEQAEYRKRNPTKMNEWLAVNVKAVLK